MISLIGCVVILLIERLYYRLSEVHTILFRQFRLSFKRSSFDRITTFSEMIVLLLKCVIN